MADETQQQASQAATRSTRQEKVGRVVSARMNKTIVVEVTRLVPDPRYKKVVRRRKKFYAHDERNQCRVGDVVRIVESRPLSRLKRWRLAEIVNRAKAVAEVELPDVPAGLAGGKGTAPGSAES